MNHHENLLKQTMDHKEDIKVVFLGDSITFAWLNSGKEIWNKYFVPRHAYNYGIGGDRTENVIWRIENKEFDGVKAKVVVLKIGKKFFPINICINHKMLLFITFKQNF
jgi:hypothetical protein